LGAFFLIWGNNGANVLVEFGKKILIIGGKRISGISSVFNWGHFLIGGIFFKLGAKNFNNWGHFFKKLGAMGQMC